MSDAIKVADAKDRVTKVITQIINIFSELVSRDSILTSKERHLVDPPSLEMYRNDVGILELPRPGGKDPKDIARYPILVGDRPREEDYVTLNEKRVNLKHENRTEMQRAILQCIKKMRYYRGSLRFRVLLGILAISRATWPQDTPSVPFEKFVANMKKGVKSVLYKK